MWWSKQTSSNNSPNVQSILTELQSDGIHLGVEELLAYQRKAALLKLVGARPMHGHMAGNYLAKTKGRGMEFDEVRHYQPGDDVRTIDWRVTARTGETHTKLYREEVERPVLIVTDLNHSMLFGSQLLFKSVQAAHVAALLAWHAKEKGDRVGGIVFNEQQHIEIKPRTRQKGVLAYIHALTQIHQNSLANWQQNKLTNTLFFQQNCVRLRQLAKPGSLVYLITDISHVDEEAIKQLVAVGQHCELVVCQLFDPLELRLPDSQIKVSVAVTDGVDKQFLTLGDAKYAQQYQQQAQQFLAEKAALLNKVGIRQIQLNAGAPLAEQLLTGTL